MCLTGLINYFCFDTFVDKLMVHSDARLSLCQSACPLLWQLTESVQEDKPELLTR